MSRLLKKYQINIWVCGYSPIQGYKVQIHVESTGQICPVVLHLFWTLSPGFDKNHTFKCWASIFPTILTYMSMLENCQNNIIVNDCSPIRGTKFYSCWNLMKTGSQSGTYTKISRKKYNYNNLLCGIPITALNSKNKNMKNITNLVLSSTPCIS